MNAYQVLVSELVAGYGVSQTRVPRPCWERIVTGWTASLLDAHRDHKKNQAFLEQKGDWSCSFSSGHLGLCWGRLLGSPSWL